MKGTIRAFSLGLFVAGIMMVVTFLFIGDASTSKKSAEELPLDEMIEVMKNEGYRVVTEEEYITLSLTDDNEEDEQAKEDENNKSNEKTDEKEGKKEETVEDEKSKEEEDKDDEVVSYTLHIKDGMPSSEIGNLLEEHNIIEDSSKFNKYLEDEGYHKGVQLGKFKVSSDMTFKELAKAITR